MLMFLSYPFSAAVFFQLQRLSICDKMKIIILTIREYLS